MFSAARQSAIRYNKTFVLRDIKKILYSILFESKAKGFLWKNKAFGESLLQLLQIFNAYQKKCRAFLFSIRFLRISVVQVYYVCVSHWINAQYGRWLLEKMQSAHMGVGRRGRGAKAAPGFWNFQQKRLFFSFEWEKEISPLLPPHWKKFGKIP